MKDKGTRNEIIPFIINYDSLLQKHTLIIYRFVTLLLVFLATSLKFKTNIHTLNIVTIYNVKVSYAQKCTLLKHIS